MNIKPLFPTPIGFFPNFLTSKERLQLIRSIKNFSHGSHGALEGDGVSSHQMYTDQRPPNILDRNIKKRIQIALDEYNNNCGNNLSQLDYTWSNIQNVGSKLREHVHPSSSVSGALYINVGEGSKLYFHNPNPYVFFTSYCQSTVYNYEHQWIPVENCELILFPSWLKHGKNDEINEIDERIVVSFNSKPK
tara:strand:- start:40 stop:612 length:573 start_codon:yes stop_codon:yes gene_type:complete